MQARLQAISSMNFVFKINEGIKEEFSHFSQLRPTLCDPIDCSPPRSSVRGILQARVLERFAMPYSRGSSRRRDQTNVSCTACMAGGFSTTEPLGRPIQEGYRLLQLCFSLVNLPFITGRVSTSKPRSVEGK